MRAIDLFAGIGGLSTGAQQAGVRVVWAANHWQLACDYYALNHGITPKCQDLHEVDWSTVPAHDLMLAAPCCQGHTHARGEAFDNPAHDRSRATANAVVDALEYHRPEVGVIENVPEFLKWVRFPAWRASIEALGYAMSINVLDAADYGVPQNRVRLFMILTRSRTPLTLKLRKHGPVPASTFVDFHAGTWSPIERPGRSPATLRRVENGRRAFGNRFLMPYYSSGSGLTGRSLDRPIGTITTKDRWAVVDGDYMRMITATEARDGMSFPRTTALPAAQADAMGVLGNAVCPLQAKRLISALRACV